MPLDARPCPLWVISGHRLTSASCPLFPLKRTFLSAVCTSAECHKQTFRNSAVLSPMDYDLLRTSRGSIRAGTHKPDRPQWRGAADRACLLAHLKLGKSPAIPDQAELPTLAPALSWVVPAEGMSPTFRVASPSNRRHAASKVRSDVQLDGNAVRWRPFPHAINLDVTGLANSSANKSLRPTWMSAPLSYWPVWAVSLDRNS